MPRNWWEENIDVRPGYCGCGCGTMTRPAARSDKRYGHVKGEPVRFVVGHHLPLGIHSVEDRGHSSPCWVWRGAFDSRGYGQVTFRGVTYRAHRFYYVEAYGAVPEGLELDHLCRMRACVNPEHLEPVSHTTNVQRGLKAKLAPEQVRDLRRAREECGLFYWQLARAFGISIPAVSHIVQRRTWTNIR